MVQSNQTLLLSSATVQKLDAGGYDDDDDPLSNRSDYKASDNDQEMAIVEEQPGTTVGNVETSPKEADTGKKDSGGNPGGPTDTRESILLCTSSQQLGHTRPGTGTLASAEAVEMCALTSLALAMTMAQIQEATANNSDNDDTDEKAQLDTYKGVMQGLHEASHTLSEGYQWACLEVQGLVNQSLNLSTEKDHRFIAEASTTLRWWVKVVQLVIDCLGKSIAEQSHLLEDAWKAGMEITKEILALYSPEGKK